MNRKGFTLIELMIVVAIIGILAFISWKGATGVVAFIVLMNYIPKVFRGLKSAIKDNKGQGMTEYVIILVCVVGVILMVVSGNTVLLLKGITCIIALFNVIAGGNIVIQGLSTAINNSNKEN